MDDLAPKVIGLVRNGFGWRLWSREEDRGTEPTATYDLRSPDSVVAAAIAWRDANLALNILMDKGRYDEAMSAAMKRRDTATKALAAAVDQVRA